MGGRKYIPKQGIFLPARYIEESQFMCIYYFSIQLFLLPYFNIFSMNTTFFFKNKIQPIELASLYDYRSLLYFNIFL